jgi:hypothetical protein
MRQRFEEIVQIYRDGLRIDWVVLGADAVGIAIVAFAFVNARAGTPIVDTAVQFASAAGF